MVLGRTIVFACVLVAAIPVVAVAQEGNVVTLPAPPSGAIEIPEPGDFGLFLIGVAGLVIGRWTSKARKRNRE